MSYVVLARKYRPGKFDDVIGQEHITELLKKGISSNRAAHAYLFCGPRGIGKTSCARILAKSLNCQDGPTVTPCDKCPACAEIAQGNSFDVLEIDGASNRGIDEIRTLRENVKFAPGFGKYKIYIVDEVHMLTGEAFNALLKTLEEPPPHVKFIFATTDPNKVLATIISRCQRYDFKRISLKLTVESLKKICKKEKFAIEDEALYAIAKAAQGSFRDALSILDQLSALSDRQIKGEDVYAMLGLVEMDLLFNLGEAIGARDCAQTLKTFEEIIDKGKDIKQLARDLTEHFRNLMVMKVGGKSLGKLLDYPVAIKEMYLAQSQKFTLKQILSAIQSFIEAQETARITESLRIPLEVAFAKLTYQEQGTPSRPAEPEGSRQKPTRSLPASVGMLKNRKGQVDISGGQDTGDELEASAEEEDIAAPQMPAAVPVELDLERIKKVWDALTHGVSREKMFIASYLQEGYPLELKGNVLTVGFASAFKFHKESIEQKEHVRLVERIFSEKLKTGIMVKYVVTDEVDPAPKEEEPIVKRVLDTFSGKIVSKWNKE